MKKTSTLKKIFLFFTITTTLNIGAAEPEIKNITINHADLHKAIENLHSQKAQNLLDTCPKDKISQLIFATNDKGENALYLAAYKEDINTVLKIIEICPPKELVSLFFSSNQDGETSLHYAAFSNNIKILQALLHACPQNKLVEFLFLENEWKDISINRALANESLEAFEILLKSCPKNKLSDFLFFEPQLERPALKEATDKEDSKFLQKILYAYELSIAKETGTGNNCKTTINRSRAQNALNNCIELYNGLEEGENKNLMLESIRNLFASCIYKTGHIISKSEQYLLSSQIASLLNNQNNNIMDNLIRTFFAALTKQPFIDEYKKTNIHTSYFGTPQQLIFHIKTQLLQKTVFKPDAKKQTVSKKKLLANLQKEKFQDVIFIFKKSTKCGGT